MLTAVTGGIGSGKSVVCRMLRVMGYEVYDCDSRAKSLVDGDRSLQRRIMEEVCREAVDISSGVIDRRLLGEIVFNDVSKLAVLNSIVHSAVRSDIKRWHSSHAGKILFIETAILYQSGLDLMVDAVWEVCAPQELRKSRVMGRDALSEGEIAARMRSQDSYACERRHARITRLVNDGINPLLPQVSDALDKIIQ